MSHRTSLIAAVALLALPGPAATADDVPAPQGTQERRSAEELLVDPAFFASLLGSRVLIHAADPALLKDPRLHTGLSAVLRDGSHQLFQFPREAEAPAPQDQPPPQFPEEFTKPGTDAEALFLVLINTDGRVVGLHCFSSTSPRFAVAGAAAIARWRYTPARIQGRAIPVVSVARFAVRIDAS